MATSQKQIDANRRNAQKSTGARSAEGKSITRLNAKRDGLTGQVITLSDEDRPIFEKLKAELIADLAPKTVMELKLASSIAWDTWRLDHLRAIEMNVYAMGTGNHDTVINCEDVRVQTAMSDALTFKEESHQFALRSIYEQRMNRSLHKNLATLLKLQAERKAAYKEDQAEEVILARYSDLNGLTYQAPAAPTQNGSVFSNHEIFAAANRKSTMEVAKSALHQAPYKVQFAGASSAGTPSTQSNGQIFADLPLKTGPGTSGAPVSTGEEAAFLSR